MSLSGVDPRMTMSMIDKEFDYIIAAAKDHGVQRAQSDSARRNSSSVPPNANNTNAPAATTPPPAAAAAPTSGTLGTVSTDITKSMRKNVFVESQNASAKATISEGFASRIEASLGVSGRGAPPQGETQSVDVVGKFRQCHHTATTSDFH